MYIIARRHHNMCSPRAITLSPFASAPSAAFFISPELPSRTTSPLCGVSIVAHDVLDTHDAHYAICTENVSDGALYNTARPLKATVFRCHCIPTTVFQH